MLSLSVENIGLRSSELQDLFASIIGSKRIQVFLRSGPTQLLAGLGPDTFGSNVRDARHPSRVGFVFVNYFEIWESLEGGRRFLLDKAYFHLDIAREDGTGDEEILALHCDPNTLPSHPSHPYNRGPHMHLAFRRFDFHKSHIALCLQNLERTCSDFSTFSTAFKDALEMIDKEFLERMTMRLS